jgi:hypothetical protein
MAMTKSAKERQPADAAPRFAPVVEAFAEDPLVRGGKMMSSWGLTVNGKIFAMFGRNQFVAKLPRGRVDELVASGNGIRFDPRRNGRAMKERITLATGEANWIELAKEAHAFVKGEGAKKSKPHKEASMVGGSAPAAPRKILKVRCDYLMYLRVEPRVGRLAGNPEFIRALGHLHP